jgi:hypothetical protein
MEQGDLRRSLAKRMVNEVIMYSTLAVKRLNDELSRYDPNIVYAEANLANAGPKILSSCVQYLLKALGSDDAYDVLKNELAKPFTSPESVQKVIKNISEEHNIPNEKISVIYDVLESMKDGKNYTGKIFNGESENDFDAMVDNVKMCNSNPQRLGLLSNAVKEVDVYVSNLPQINKKIDKFTGEIK